MTGAETMLVIGIHNVLRGHQLQQQTHNAFAQTLWIVLVEDGKLNSQQT